MYESHLYHHYQHDAPAFQATGQKWYVDLVTDRTDDGCGDPPTGCVSIGRFNGVGVNTPYNVTVRLTFTSAQSTYDYQSKVDCDGAPLFRKPDTLCF